MLKRIIRLAIRRRGVIIGLACLLVGYGIYTVYQSRLDVFPEFAPPMAIIQTEAPGLSSEQVEMLVTQPIENALGGASGLASMRSRSLPGLAMISLTFDAGIDVYRARQLAAERLGTLAGKLPLGVKPPALLPLSSSTGVAMVIGLTAPTRSAMALYDLAQWTLRPQLLNLPGVADVVVFGGAVRQYQIRVDPQKLVRTGLSLQDVLSAARRATGIRGAGFIENDNQRIAIQTDGQIQNVAQLAQVVVRYSNGVGLHLGDVADIVVAPAPAVGAAAIGTTPGVMLIVEAQYRADTLAITRAVDHALAGLQALLKTEHVALHADIFRPANFILAAIAHLRSALLLGGILVVAVLFLFLMNARTAFISAAAIPLSLLAAVIVLHRLGVSLNTMTLGGLAIALGEVVDDAVVDAENIFRRLRQNRQLAQPLSAARVVLQASLEVRSAVVYATFIVILVFFPVLSLSGVAGRLFAPLGIAYIVAILASLAVALVVTPALAYVLLADRPLRVDEPRLVRALKTRYGILLTRLARHTQLMLTLIAVLSAAALASLPFLGGDFIPALREGHYIVHMALAPGTSLTESMRIGRHISQALSAVPGVRLVAQRAGRAAEVVDPTDVNTSEFEVDLDPMSGPGQARALSAIQQALSAFPGVTTSVNTFLAERIDETISGDTAPISIQVFGNDLDVLDAKAREIAAVLNRIPGAIGVVVRSPPGAPQLTIRLRHDQLTRYGFAPLDVLDAIQAASQGIEVAQRFDGNRVYDLSVSLRPDWRKDPAAIGALPLRNSQGEIVSLRRLAWIGQTQGRYQIQHLGGQRLQTVSAAVRGRSVSDFVADAQARIAREVRLPRGTYLVFSGEAQARSKAQHEILVNTLIAVGGIVLLLILALGSSRAVLLVLLNLPFALIGGVAVLLYGGGNFSLGSLIGFVTLFGITLRNSIMLISHYQHLVNEEGLPWHSATAYRGASERLVPILMTALVTGLGLLPLALDGSAPGNEIEGPMAAVILGGLFTSTALNLLVLPILAARYGRFVRKPALATRNG